MKPEERARKKIDDLLEQANWTVQDMVDLNLSASVGVAVREFPLSAGFADYLLFVNEEPVGVIEAKKVGQTLIGVEEQSAKYLTNLPAILSTEREQLAFSYETTGIETRFTNHLDPEPRSRRVFAFHQPETLAAWLEQAPVGVPNAQNDTMLARLTHLPPLMTTHLRDCQIEAITNLEASFAQNKRRALIQMATGSGKTYTSVSSIYRLIKFGGVKRVVFLVDRTELGKQALNEFQQYVTPDDGRKFTDIYNVQRLQNNRIDPVANVCITTIQRLYSMLCGEAELDPALEEQSQFELDNAQLNQAPKEVRYNPTIPIETFDVIITDECHRSIYNLWSDMLEYFDAFIVGLTATPNGLRSIRADIIALQEVSTAAYQELVDSSLFSWSAFSLDIRPPEKNEGRGRQLGCAVLGQTPFRLMGSSLLESTPLPERTLIVELESPAGPLKVCSFHAPPGVSWHEKKPQSFLALAHWLAQHPSGVIVGMDANAPKRDHPDHQQNEWWWEEEECLLGYQPLHSLKDALRVWLAANPLEAESIREVKPYGPLAVSYDRGQATSTPCRYDFIYSTTDFAVSQVRYLYDEALNAGSDHALVVADLTLIKNGISSATNLFS